MSENKKENYHILSLIGHGAYGQVFKGRRKGTGQFVAIKTITKKGKEEKDKVMRDQIDILRQLKHENIVLLLEAFETASDFILVTELGQGQLFNIIENDQWLEMPEVRKVAQQLVRALHYIHSNRILHRDLKPQNVLMTSDGVIKLCDFGFARCMSYNTEVLTSLKGTPLYMAPEVVKQQPYNHTADLWSLGVILYELATGTPPFTASNLISLVEHISKDPIVYPDSIQGDFRDLLKGLLNKDPKRRLAWPQLLTHPFLKESEGEKNTRKKKNQHFAQWVEENRCDSAASSRPFSQNQFEERKEKQEDTCNDPQWNNYFKVSSQDHGAEKLKKDPSFQQALLAVLSISIADIIRIKDKRNLLIIALKTLTNVLLLAQKTQVEKSVAKNINVPPLIIDLLHGFLRLDGGRQFVEIIGQMVRIIGLLGRANSKKGVQIVYIRSFLPELQKLVQLSCEPQNEEGEIHQQALTVNVLRTVGMFVNNASSTQQFSFYHGLVESKFISECKRLLRAYERNPVVLRVFVQVLSALVHPIAGQIQGFPWLARSTLPNRDFQFFDCIRQEVVNILIQSRYEESFELLLQVEDGSLLGLISLIRILLQSVRISKEFTESLLKHKRIIKLIFSLLGNTDQVVFATSAQLAVQLLKFCRDRRKEKILEGFHLGVMSAALEHLKIPSKPDEAIIGFASFMLLQEIIALEGSNFMRVVEQIQGEPVIFRLAVQYLEKSTGRIEEMRKLEGSNNGLHTAALCDSACFFLHRLFSKTQKEAPKKMEWFLRAAKDAKLVEAITNLLRNLSARTDLSLRGMISLLMLAYDLANSSPGEQFSQEAVLATLIALLKEDQADAVLGWSSLFGGGQACLQTIFGNLMRLFLVCLQEAEKHPQILKRIYDLEMLQLLIRFCRFLNLETLGPVITFIMHLLAFDPQDLRSDGPNFVSQFVSEGGLTLYRQFKLLDSESQPPSALVEAVNLLSQVARSSKENYEPIQSLQPVPSLKALLMHRDTQVKARVLHLIGNLCRHSGYFYSHLRQLLPSCISLCQDSDATISKFACVAIGNAGFHDDTLYDTLRSSVTVLVGLLKISEEKTRSNAAAALGNLARNSTSLDSEFIKTGANFQLLAMLNNDKSIAARKVSVMAIHNLLSLPESRKILLGQNVGECLQRLLCPPFSQDSSLVKAVHKSLQKLK